MLTYETLKSFCADDDIRPALRFAHLDDGKWIATNSCAIIVAPQALCHPDEIRFLNDELPEHVGRFPTYKAVVNLEADTPHTLTTGDILQAIGRCPKVDEMRAVEKPIHYIDCTFDDCDDGEVTLTDSTRWRGHHYELEAKCECPICHGYGKIPDFDDYNPDEDDYDPGADKTYFSDEPTGHKVPDLTNTVVGICGVYFRADLLHLLLRVCRDMGTEEIQHSKPIEGQIIHLNVGGIYIGIMPIHFDAKSKKKYKVIEL